MQSNKKLQRAAIANLANLVIALSPHIQQKALTLQSQVGSKDSKPKEPKSIKMEKQVEELAKTGRKSPPTLPTIKEEIDYRSRPDQGFMHQSRFVLSLARTSLRADGHLLLLY